MRDLWREVKIFCNFGKINVYREDFFKDPTKGMVFEAFNLMYYTVLAMGWPMRFK